MRALVTGGAGFIGSYLIEYLISKGCKIRAIVRRESSAEILEEIGCEVVIADIKDSASLQGVMDDTDYVFHLASEITSRNKKSMWLSNVVGTENLLKESLKSKIKRFVFASSISVMGSTGGLAADEEISAAIPKNDFYSITKLEAEKLCQKYFKYHNTPIVILRFPGVYGQNNLMIERFYKFIKMGVMPYLGNGETYLSWVYLNDIVNVMEKCTDHDYCCGEIFILCDDEPVKMRDFIDSLCLYLCGRKPIWKIPTWAIKFTASIIEYSAKTLGKKPAISRYFVNYICEDHIYSNAKAKSMLGFKPSYNDSLTGIIEAIGLNDYC
ncbi:MAG: NAD(P)-dependent oxidoreductase [Actinobacteria bacterium]|nr:NAD(P)-dependent oxidoreductase [Actinomycetota bacterium]